MSDPMPTVKWDRADGDGTISVARGGAGVYIISQTLPEMTLLYVHERDVPQLVEALELLTTKKEVG